MKKWVLTEPAVSSPEITSAYPGVFGKLLQSRGISSMEQLNEYFSCDSLSNPYLMQDMQEAVDTIRETLDEGGKITVFGDYDCDGVTATAILFNYLDSLGAEADFYIPQRSEGYGMNMDAVKRIAENGTKLVITVDNGISQFSEAEYLINQGVKLVITDHHTPQDTLPVCTACVNPHRADDSSPFKDLCGAGVALKLLCALEEDTAFALEQYADLAAVGTIGDVMPLCGENRYIVTRGLESIKNGTNIGLAALAKCAGLTADRINSTAVAFSLCPRINAAGRVDDAAKAVRLLMAETPEAASLLSEELELCNTRRRDIEKTIADGVFEKLSADPSLLYGRVIIVSGEGWHHGVVGLMCSRLVERYGKPAFVISTDGSTATGSARGIDGFNVFRLLDGCADIFTKYGGHPKAGGFSLPSDRVEEFRQRAEQYCSEHYPKMPELCAYADVQASCAELSLDTGNLMTRMEPFGEGNQLPVFMLTGCTVVSKRALKDGKYTSFEVESGGARLKALTFSVPFAKFRFDIGASIDLLATAEINEYNGNTSVNLKVREFRPTGFREDRFFASQRVYEEIKRGEGCDKRLAPRIIPDRAALMGIYDMVKKNAGMSAEDMSVYCGNVNYCMLRIALDAFAQAEMITLTPGADSAQLVPVKAKRDLFAQGILAELTHSLA